MCPLDDTAFVFVSDAQLAERYGVNRSTIWRWSKAGKLPEPKQISAAITRWWLPDVIAAEAAAGHYPLAPSDDPA